MGFIESILGKVGIESRDTVNCIQCKRDISPEERICPHCDAWNDCCSVDPRTL